MKFIETIKFIKKQFDTNKFIPLHEPVFFGNEKKYLSKTIDSTFVSSIGEYVNRFEKEFALYNKSNYSVAVVNGTSALHLCLRVIGVKTDDEVITQALTFVATCNSISYLGAVPTFIDVDIDTLGMSPIALENFLNKYAEIRKNGTFNKKTNKRISACLPMHTFGLMSNIEKIVSICNKWNIPVVEDAAESFGSKMNNIYSGNFGKISAFSFNGNKIITSGGGGIIVTQNKFLAIKAKHLSTTAKINHKWNFDHDNIAYNYRMPNINAALACAQLENFEAIKKSKENLFNQYKLFFNDQGMNFITNNSESNWNYWLMSLMLENKKERDLFLKETNESNIMTRPIWRLMFRLPMYKDCFRDSQKNAKFLEDRIVNIPSSARL